VTQVSVRAFEARGQTLARRAAQAWLGAPGGPAWPACGRDEELGLPVPVASGPDVLRCLAEARSGLCERPAGKGTYHPGVGRCRRHEGATGRAEGAWMVGHLIAVELDVSPWQALLTAVRRAAGAAAWYHEKLAEAPGDAALAVGGSHRGWLEDWRDAQDRMVRYSKLAIDAGVAAAMVTQARGEGEQLARVLNAALGEAELDEETETRLRQALRRALLAQDGGPMLPGGLAVGQ